MNYKDFTDEELIAKLRAGDAEIADYIMEKYKPLVRKKTNAMYLIGGETEDLIQEGMIGLFKAVRDFDPEKEVAFFAFAEICITRQLYSALEASNRKKHQPAFLYPLRPDRKLFPHKKERLLFAKSRSCNHFRLHLRRYILLYQHAAGCGNS